MENWFELTKPPAFRPTVEISGCYCICGDLVLFLKRHPNKPYGETWGVPAGKMEKGETPTECIVRELHEETGIAVGSGDVHCVGTLYCRIPSLDFTYHMFCKKFDEIPPLTLGLEEHTDWRWVTYAEALKLPLIVGGAEALAHYRALIPF